MENEYTSKVPTVRIWSGKPERKPEYFFKLEVSEGRLVLGIVDEDGNEPPFGGRILMINQYGELHLCPGINKEAAEQLGITRDSEKRSRIKLAPVY